MHERSLMLALLKQVSSIQEEYGGAAVLEIAVEAGSLSGVEPELLHEAFREFVTQHPQANLTVKTGLVTARCKSCEHKWAMEKFASECPACQSSSVQITGGDAFQLLYVKLME
ncbi:MAG: hydrogenase maturation nickel metallochaperone HypA [Planctomycetia bacterium]|nr:hydrogenase maturation nickel metallochaperone HypA [Planctomycetia bacterium]